MKKLFLTFYWAVLIAPLSAAVVHLKDGTDVRGTIISATARDVRLHTDSGEVTLQSDQIKSVDYAESEPQVVPTQNQSPQPPQAVVAPEQVPARHYYRRRAEVERASPAPEDQMFSVGFGFATPLSRVSLASTGGGDVDNGDTGILLGAQYHYFFTPRFAAGLDFEYMNRSRSDSQGGVPGTNTSVFGDSALYMATLRYSLTGHGPVRPYVLGGVGANRTTTIVEVTPNPGLGWPPDGLTDETRTFVDDSHWGLAETARLGLDFMLADPAIFSLEFGWTGISNSGYAATPAGQEFGLSSVSGNLSVFTLAARWGWKF